MDDKEIVELYIKQDENAIRETIFKYKDMCYGVAYNILHNNEDVEECLNDVWIALWKRIHISKPVYLKAYIIKTVRNMAVNYVKRKEKHNEVSIENVGEGELSATQVPQVENEEANKLINDFLETLSIREKAIFVSRYFFEEDTKIIAKKFKTTDTAIRSTLYRNRKRLEKFMEKRWNGWTKKR